MSHTVRRTAKVKLDVEPEDKRLLKETFERFREACQYSVDKAWENYEEEDFLPTSRSWYKENVYEKAKQKTGLQSGIIQKAQDSARNALKQVKEKWNKGKKASKPEFKSEFTAFDNRSISYTKEGCKLSTFDNQVKVKFELPEEDSPQTEYLSEEWTKKEATLHHRDGKFYLHITVEKTVEETDENENCSVLGVDLNVDGTLAVTSTGCFIGSSDYLNHLRDQYEKKRGELQQCGTQSAHRTLQDLGGRFARWSEQYLHEMANKLLTEAVERDCSTIVFEDLEGIRERISNGKKFQQWAFNKFYRIVDYKAVEYGIRVEQECPRDTSRACSYCGYVDPCNRDSKDEFSCDECGREYHADYNAAKNIGLKHVRAGQKSQDGRATRQLALKSGSLTLREDEKCFHPVEG